MDSTTPLIPQLHVDGVMETVRRRIENEREKAERRGNTAICQAAEFERVLKATHATDKAVAEVRSYAYRSVPAMSQDLYSRILAIAFELLWWWGVSFPAGWSIPNGGGCCR